MKALECCCVQVAWAQDYVAESIILWLEQILLPIVAEEDSYTPYSAESVLGLSRLLRGLLLVRTRLVAINPAARFSLACRVVWWRRRSPMVALRGM